MGTTPLVLRLLSRRRVTSVVTAAAFAGVSLVIAAAPAHATAPTTALNFSGDSALQNHGFARGCDSCIPGDAGVGVRLAASVSAHWAPSALVSYQYSQSLLRQGQTLDLTDKLTPLTGTLTLTWGLTGDAGGYNFTGSGPQFPAAGSESAVVTINESVAATTVCALKLSGDGTYACQATHSFAVGDASFWGFLFTTLLTQRYCHPSPSVEAVAPLSLKNQ